ncbi:MAG: pirin family protein [Gelidibacter sp.]
MKTIIHKAKDRGHANHGWLQAYHSFSFANYFDPDKIQFGALRVLNDDTIAPKMGFGTHPHDNMEIITIPLSGILKHRDNIHQDWQSVLPGEVQVMSAGTGVKHSEINGSDEESLSLFQIWIIPNKRNVAPQYSQKSFSPDVRKNTLQTLVTSVNNSDEGSLKIYQDAFLSRIDLGKGQSFDYQLRDRSHGVYVMIVSGDVVVANEKLKSRDALGISETDHFKIHASEASEVLFIEVPMHV